MIAELLDIQNYNPQRKVGCCPNPSHDDSTPSCSYNPKTQSFHCFGCGSTYDLVDAYMIKSNCSFIDACKYLFEQAGMSYDFTEKDSARLDRRYRYPQPKYADNKDKVYEYWARRKISKRTIDYLGIAQDTDGNTLFQYYDLNDILVTVKVRVSGIVRKEDGRPKIWHLPNADHMDILYNMNRINPSQPLIITSGEGDCATCIECGCYNAVSINGGDQNTKWIGECWDWLQQFEEIILIHDNDDSGRKFAKDVTTRLGEYRIKIVDIPEAVPKPSTGEAVSVNDLNELLYWAGPEAVRDVIQNAKETEIPTVIDYTDVKRFNMMDVEGFYTGLSEMDQLLDKFYMGTTTILTGSPGSGKSTFLSTIICKSVEQGFPVYIYSGELSNPALKSWIDYVHAGPRGLMETINPITKIKSYRPKNDTYRAINNTYKGKVLFYKDGFEQKVSKIMSTAESVVRRYGVRTMIFDNMTSMDMESTDDTKYQRQEDFIRQIIAFAIRWNVCCIVVLHPKKLSEMRRMSLYDLSGTSSAANLANRVLALYRVPPKEQNDGCPWDVTIEVLKDRFGSAGGKTVGLWYDQPSRRFFDSMESLDHKYAWDTNDYSGQPFPYEIPQLARLDEADREVFGKIKPQGA